MPRPASLKGPTGPTLRANPFPEVTDLICRLPLPTLIYRLEAIHLGDLLRIWVRTRPKVRDGVLAVREGPRNSAVMTGRYDGVLRGRKGPESPPFPSVNQSRTSESLLPRRRQLPFWYGVPERVLRPWVSALACIFKDRRRRTGRRKNRGALRYHDPIALRVASRVTES